MLSWLPISHWSLIVAYLYPGGYCVCLCALLTWNTENDVKRSFGNRQTCDNCLSYKSFWGLTKIQAADASVSVLPCFPNIPKASLLFWQHYKSSVERERNTFEENKVFTYLENWFKAWMTLNRWKTGQRVITSRNAFFSLANCFVFLSPVPSNISFCLYSVSVNLCKQQKKPSSCSSSLTPQTHWLYLAVPRARGNKWRFHPFFSSGVRAWLLELLDVSVNLLSVTLSHHKQRLRLCPWSWNDGVLLWIPILRSL